MVITLVLFPALLPGLARGAAAEAPAGTRSETPSTELVAAAGPSGATPPVVGDVLDTLPPTVPEPTTTTTAATTTTTRPRPTTTTVAPRLLTTTTLPTPVVTVPPIVGTTQTGRATWYQQEVGVCAHRTLPFGTAVTVTATATGASITCTVGDRGPFVVSSIIDLAPEDFAQLAELSSGLVAVTLSWG